MLFRWLKRYFNDKTMKLMGHIITKAEIVQTASETQLDIGLTSSLFQC